MCGECFHGSGGASRSHYWKLAGPTLVERGNDILLRLQELAFETLHFVQVLNTYFKFPVKFIPSLHGLCNLDSYFFSFSRGHSIRSICKRFPRSENIGSVDCMTRPAAAPMSEIQELRQQVAALKAEVVDLQANVPVPTVRWRGRKNSSGLRREGRRFRLSRDPRPDS